MIATVLQTFVDAPAGREEKKYFVGDVISIAKNDYERITKQGDGLLKEGKHNLGTGICYPCIKGVEKLNRRPKR